MKHAVSNSKPKVKARPLSGKSVVEKSSKIVKTDPKKRKIVLLENTETKSAKKAAAKKPIQIVKLPVKKNSPVKSFRAAKTKLVETPKSKIQKASSEEVKTVKIAAKKNQPVAPKQIIKTQAAKIKVFAAAKTETTQSQKSKLAAAIKTAKIVAVKKPSTVLGSSAKAKPKKNQPVIAVKKIVLKTPQPKSIAPIVKAKSATKNVTAAAAIKKSDIKTVGKIKELKSVEPTKKIKVTAIKTEPKNLKAAQTLKKTKIKSAISDKENKVPAKTENQKVAVAVAQLKKPKVVENKAKETQAARSEKPKNKKAKPISSAVFRGKKNRYDFKVFALNEIFEAIPAVYIISKRKTDRLKKGHHALICIGATDSIFDEMKKHRKGKCVKKHQANVVSILPEANEKIRLKIETDLKAAHSVACNLE